MPFYRLPAHIYLYHNLSKLPEGYFLIVLGKVDSMLHVISHDPAPAAAHVSRRNFVMV